MPLPSFTFTGNVFDVFGNVAANELVENGFGAGGRAPATVTFTPNVPQNQFVTWSGHAERLKPVVATIGSDGHIKRNGDTVRLTANDPGLSVTGLQYRVDVEGMKPFTFDAPSDGGTVDFATVVPVAYVAAVGLTKGDKGDPVDDVQSALSDTAAQFYVQGQPIGDPLVLPSAAWGSILGKPFIPYITPEDFGAVGNGTTNDLTALNNCFAAAAGKLVWLDPSKTYAHNDVVTIAQNGVIVTGGGTLKATNVTGGHSAVDVQGDNVTLDHINLTCPTATVRISTGNDCKLILNQNDGAVVRNVTINGSSNMGLLVFGATNYRVESCLVKNTMADGYHSTYGSANGLIVNCASENTGDDGFAVVSYGADPAITSNITIRGFSVKNSAARGITVGGSTNVRYFDGKIDGTAAAGITVMSETTFSTSSVSDVVIANIDVVNANTGAPGVVNGGILVLNNRAGGFSIDNVTLTDIRFRDTDVDAAWQIALQNLGGGTITGIKLGPMTFAGTKPADVLYTAGTVEYVDNIAGDIATHDGRVKDFWYVAAGTEYRLLATLPVDNSGNISSLTFEGRLGGWAVSDAANWKIFLGNRTPSFDASAIKSSVTAQGAVNEALVQMDIVVYAQADKSAKVYLKLLSGGFYMYDLVASFVQATLKYDGVSSTATPTGTLIWQLSTAEIDAWVPVPSSATATGRKGQRAADSSFQYTCTAANTWRRVAIASW